MTCKEVKEYMSAFVDRDYSGMSERDISLVWHYIDDCPECSQEMQLELETKIYFTNHYNDIPCPHPTFLQIQSYLYHLYKSSQHADCA